MSDERRGEFRADSEGRWYWAGGVLDEPIDCESCGPSFDEADVETEDFERFEVRVRVGCYGGSHAEGDLDTVVSHLLDEWGHLAYTKDVTRALRAAVAEAKEMA